VTTPWSWIHFQCRHHEGILFEPASQLFKPNLGQWNPMSKCRGFCSRCVIGIVGYLACGVGISRLVDCEWIVPVRRINHESRGESQNCRCATKCSMSRFPALHWPLFLLTSYPGMAAPKPWKQKSGVLGVPPPRDLANAPLRDRLCLTQWQKQFSRPWKICLTSCFGISWEIPF
jgi:hypothetical protein